MSIVTPGSGLAAELQAMAQQAAAPDAGRQAQAGGGFAQALSQSIDRIDALKSEAVAAGQAYEQGVPGVGLNEVMVSMAKADVGTNMGIQVRNRVVSAYQDIMNMQV